MLDLHNLPNAIPEEKLVYFLRRHPITLFTVVVGYLMLIIAPFVIFGYLQGFQPDILFNQTFQVIAVFGGSAFFLFAWLFLFQLFLDYYLDSWIVTTKRIINIEQTGLFGRTVSELRLYRIQDVTATVNGFTNTMFNYGDVQVQTAGEIERFVFEEIPRPNEIAKAILELSEIDRREHLDDTVEDFAMADKRRNSKLAKIHLSTEEDGV